MASAWRRCCTSPTPGFRWSPATSSTRSSLSTEAVTAGASLATDRLVDLDDPAALGPELVGIKAARLAQARRAGFPVLPGLCVTVPVAAPTMAAASAALDSAGIVPARRIVDGGLPADLASELTTQAQALGPRLVVRSSTALDDDGAWSGSFASYGDLTPAEVATGVRGCWSSLFAVDTLARFAETARSPGEAGIAVLVQPQVEPRAGGWVGFRSGRITISAVPGHPAALLHGWVTGVSVELSVEHAPTDVEIEGLPIGRQEVEELVRLTRHAVDALDATRLEWALAGDRLVVFQIGRAGRFEAANRVPELGSPLSGVEWQRLADALIDRRGPLVSQLVAPWACGAANLVVGPPTGGSPADLLQRALAFADELTRPASLMTGLAPDEIVVRMCAGDAAVAGTLAGVPVDRSIAGELLGSLDEVAIFLTSIGTLPRPEAIWFQTVDWLRSAVAGRPHPPPTRRAADLWTETLYRISAATASPVRGIAAVPGLAVGRVAQASGAEMDELPPLGSVLLVDEPVPTLAPLLWTASALVARTGSPAAHLCEVARSLHLPTVVSAGLPSLADRSVIALDGHSGEVLVGRP